MTGAIVLALGILAAGIFYWNAVHRPDPDNLDAVLDGYSRSTHHEMGVQMGTLGLIMLGMAGDAGAPDHESPHHRGRDRALRVLLLPRGVGAGR